MSSLSSSHVAQMKISTLLLGSWLRPLERGQMVGTKTCRLMSYKSHVTWDPSEPGETGKACSFVLNSVTCTVTKKLLGQSRSGQMVVNLGASGACLFRCFFETGGVLLSGDEEETFHKRGLFQGKPSLASMTFRETREGREAFLFLWSPHMFRGPTWGVVS